MNKIISFSLYGKDDIYATGAIENARIALELFPEWKTRFYIDDLVSQATIDQLIECNAQIVFKGKSHGISGMFWRFQPMFEPDTIMLSRDTDSRLSNREKAAVNQWLITDKSFHIMRDHPMHKAKIMGGMFGCKNTSKINYVKKIFTSFKRTANYGDDQFFLSRVIYPIIKKDVVIHSSGVIYDNETIQDFPSQRINNEFIGMGYREKIIKRNFIPDTSIHLNTTKKEKLQVLYYKILSHL